MRFPEALIEGLTMARADENHDPPASVSDLMADHLLAVHALAEAIDDDHVVSVVRSLLLHLARAYAADDFA